MKFVCICQYGHSRSVAMCRSLHHNGHEAIAVGEGTSPSALPILAGWADVVIVMDAGFGHNLHTNRPTYNAAVGPDIWSNPYNPDLRALCDKFRDEWGW